MRLGAICTCFMMVLAMSAVHAGEPREIELTDGSVLSGEVVSLSNGVYTIKTGSLGTIRVEEARVRSISAKSSPAGEGAKSNNTAGQVNALQGRLMSDDRIMGLIQSLRDDPEFKKALEDPAIMKAVQAGDVAALTSNPEFMKLLKNPTVLEIEKKAK